MEYVIGFLIIALLGAVILVFIGFIEDAIEYIGMGAIWLLLTIVGLVYPKIRKSKDFPGWKPKTESAKDESAESASLSAISEEIAQPEQIAVSEAAVAQTVDKTENTTSLQ
ncbi:hypothetical protein KRX54_02505 [Actinomycetaceae bacterium TAE3-ERU4]|nr:hypothetical protein [Actinomycetaceae bacterium TAE3-ERU4]